MDGVTNGDHTPYLIDLVNQGSAVIPDFDSPIPEIFIYPEEAWHIYVPGSEEAVYTLFGKSSLKLALAHSNKMLMFSFRIVKSTTICEPGSNLFQDHQSPILCRFFWDLVLQKNTTCLHLLT